MMPVDGLTRLDRTVGAGFFYARKKYSGARNGVAAH